jgi:hypothetical protein
MKKIAFVAVFYFVAFMSEAQAPKYSNEFLSIGVGARALGMSNSIVSAVNDATAGYWNPARLLKMEGDLQVNLMHSSYFKGIASYNYAAVGVPVDSSRALAFSIIRFGVDDIPDTSELIDPDGNINYDKIKSFSIADYAFLVSFARSTAITGLSLGGSAKVIHRKVGKFGNAWGFGLDAGASYERNGWVIGALGKDITSTFNAWSFNTDPLKDVFQATGNELPVNSLEITLPKLIVSGSKNYSLSERFSIMPVVDVDFTFDGKRNVLLGADPVSADPHAGVEVGYSKLVFLRFGGGNIQRVTEFDGSRSWTVQPNAGVGLKIGNFNIDYALTNLGRETEVLYSHVFSLKLNVIKQSK